MDFLIKVYFWVILKFGATHCNGKGMGKITPFFEVGMASVAPPPPLDSEILKLKYANMCDLTRK